MEERFIRHGDYLMVGHRLERSDLSGRAVHSHDEFRAEPLRQRQRLGLVRTTANRRRAAGRDNRLCAPPSAGRHRAYPGVRHQERGAGRRGSRRRRHDLSRVRGDAPAAGAQRVRPAQQAGARRRRLARTRAARRSLRRPATFARCTSRATSICSRARAATSRCRSATTASCWWTRARATSATK